MSRIIAKIKMRKRWWLCYATDFHSLLQLFSLQILHHKNTFSVKDFTIDATLLAAIMGNITTYLLILIQFVNISHRAIKEQRSIFIQNLIKRIHKIG
ncbi:hypothetical protein ALC60_01100 [Trachymyrmex zeteki]|uniref:Gustatory receptor n=1 Tax=Mycetomoellerius zeteki TaxID=64791 RepID=A0A151XHI9_9HYME|nr:hypothetical protein ALC60_01100 [Trachymyrmex zeteki]